MAFGMAWNFRSNALYVSDPSYAVAAVQQAYPHTYTNVDGYSINAGISAGSGGAQDLDSGNDPRIAGNNYSDNSGTPRVFTIDLSSGSAPGAGTYAIDLALGDPTQGRVASFRVKDNTTVVIDGTNAGSGFSTAADHYIDASLADVNATTSWTGATAQKVFASTTVNVEFGAQDVADFSLLAHFRLTLVEVEENEGTLAVTLGALTSVATGVLSITGSAAPPLGALTTTAAGALGITGQAGITLGGLTTTATGALPVAGVAAITLEELALGATGDLAIAGEAAITLGALTAHGFDAPPSISAGRQGHSAHRFIRGRGRPH